MEINNTLENVLGNSSENAAKSAAGRLRFVDIAKGFSIICIILGHLGIHNITRVVFTFHVPIFYLITGYFVSRKEGVRDFAVKKARTLLVPYFATSLVMIAVAAGIGLSDGSACGAVRVGRAVRQAVLYQGDRRDLVLVGELLGMPFPARVAGAGGAAADRDDRGAVRVRVLFAGLVLVPAERSGGGVRGGVHVFGTLVPGGRGGPARALDGDPGVRDAGGAGYVGHVH